ncbi:MAG: CHAT domain-containing protein [Ginsengibacter sp.]
MSDVQLYKEIVILVSEKKITLNGQMPLPYNKDEIKLQSSVARTLQRVLRSYKFGSLKEKIFDNEDYLLLGQLLCQILIGESVQGFIQYVLQEDIDSKNKKLKKRCRIYLQFEQGIDEELALLPWEYTWAQLKDMNPLFLAADLAGQFDFIRKTDNNDIQFTPEPNKKILIILVYTEAEKIDTRPLKKMKSDLETNKEFKDLIIIREIIDPTYAGFGKELDKILKQEKQNISGFIIHYYGHAKVEDEKGQISLMNEAGADLEYILDSEFADFFQDAGRRPEVIVLQACSSGQIVKYNNLEKRGVALLLSLKAIPAVVAMQNDVNVPDSFAFFEMFYTAILQGDDVAEGVTKGRQHLGSTYLEGSRKMKYSTNAFGAPILFISTKSPIQLFEKKTNVLLEVSDEKEEFSMAEKTETGKVQNEPRKASEDISEEKAENVRDKDQATPQKAVVEIKIPGATFNL